MIAWLYDDEPTLMRDAFRAIDAALPRGFHHRRGGVLEGAGFVERGRQRGLLRALVRAFEPAAAGDLRGAVQSPIHAMVSGRCSVEGDVTVAAASRRSSADADAGRHVVRRRTVFYGTESGSDP